MLVVGNVAAEGLAPLVLEASADTVMTKLISHMYSTVIWMVKHVPQKVDYQRHAQVCSIMVKELFHLYPKFIRYIMYHFYTTTE